MVERDLERGVGKKTIVETFQIFNIKLVIKVNFSRDVLRNGGVHFEDLWSKHLKGYYQCCGAHIVFHLAYYCWQSSLFSISISIDICYKVLIGMLVHHCSFCPFFRFSFPLHLAVIYHSNMSSLLGYKSLGLPVNAMVST